MKKTVQKEIHVCDHCGQESSFVEACMNCGVEACYDCRKTHGVHYNHAVYFQGSGDGYYCKPCDRKLSTDGSDARHKAYRVIKSLRAEHIAWSEEFKRRQEIAEDTLKKLGS